MCGTCGTIACLKQSFLASTEHYRRGDCDSKSENELSRSNLTGYQKTAIEFIPRASPPNVLIGGLVPVSPVVSPVEPPIRAFGNDGL
jgi:hypothetical protein